MKIISSKTNSDGTRIVCEDAVFDPSLASLIKIDAQESMVVLGYDALECGHPLNLPVESAKAEFFVKFTPTDIHIYMLASDVEYDENLSAYYNDVGDIEFDVRMTDKEKQMLLRGVSYMLLSKYK